MPSSNRWRIKRRLDESIGRLRKGQNILVEEGKLYEQGHREYYDVFCITVQSIEGVINTIVKLRDML